MLMLQRMLDAVVDFSSFFRRLEGKMSPLDGNHQFVAVISKGVDDSKVHSDRQWLNKSLHKLNKSYHSFLQRTGSEAGASSPKVPLGYLFI